MPLTQPESVMRRLWQRMAEVYGHRWTSAYGDDAGTGAGMTWAIGLARLTTDQIATGLDAAIASADGWPPTLPEFRAMCLEIPSLAVTKNALRLRGEISDHVAGFARLVWSHIDAHRFRLADAEREDRMIAEAYEIACSHVMRGGALPMDSPAIEAPEEESLTPASEETARAALERMQAVVDGARSNA